MVAQKNARGQGPKEGGKTYFVTFGFFLFTFEKFFVDQDFQLCQHWKMRKIYFAKKQT